MRAAVYKRKEDRYQEEGMSVEEEASIQGLSAGKIIDCALVSNKMRTAAQKRIEDGIQEEGMSVVEEPSIQGLSAVPEVVFHEDISIDEVAATQDEGEAWGEASIREVAVVDRFAFYDAETADVNFEFTTNGRTTLVPAHKCLLAYQSLVFRQMFFGGMKDDLNIITRIRIIDATIDEFIEFVRHFYYDEMEITAINVRAMTYLTHKYNVELFEHKCKYFLTRMVRLNKVSIFWVLPMATQYNYDMLRETCIDSIHSNGKLLIECLKFANCSLETLKTVLSIDFNDRDEARVFEKCISWAEESCEQKNLHPKSRENIRNQLGDSFELIRFDKMSPSQFTKCLSKHSHLFLASEIGNIATTVKGQDREFSTVVVPAVVKVREVFFATKPTIRRLVFDVDTADVFFTFDGSPGKDEQRTVTAHKCILSANSSTFKSELMAVNKSYTIHITDTSYDDYSIFIKICYGYTNLFSHHLSNESVDKILLLLKKYNVRVRDRCLSAIEDTEDELMSIQDDENLFWLFELSRIHSLHCLHLLCISQIETERDIFSSESFLNLCPESFENIFSIVLNKLDAATVCEAGFKWAKAVCERNDMEKSGENIRTALGNVWPMMPFSSLKPVEFIRYRRDLGNIFTSEQIKNIIDTLADEYETDESDMSTDEVQADTSLHDSGELDGEPCDEEVIGELDGKPSDEEVPDSEFQMESDDDSSLEDDSISDGELEYLRSE